MIYVHTRRIATAYILLKYFIHILTFSVIKNPNSSCNRSIGLQISRKNLFQERYEKWDSPHLSYQIKYKNY